MNGDDPGPVIHVVAGAVIDAAGRVLIAQRPRGTHLAGGWEFPGGKLEPGEERVAGLARELREELGITIARPPRPLTRVHHAYPSRRVLLDVWVVQHYSGTPHGLDAQALRWCTQDELATVDMLPADEPIVRALRLPERLTEVATCVYEILSMEGTGTSGGGRLKGVYCQSVAEAPAAVDSGADFLVLTRLLASDELTALCRSVSVPVYAPGISISESWSLGASGVNDLVS